MKRLITASVVRQERQAGNKRLVVCLEQCIITPEARTVAEQLGLQIVDSADASCASCTPCTPCADPSELAAIRAAIMAKLPEGTVSAELVDQLIAKAVKQQSGQKGRLPAEGTYRSSTNPSGIKHVRGESITMGVFEGAGVENQVGTVDVITDADGSTMGCGFLEWDNCFFPWTLTYDEVSTVLEGELHIRCNGHTTIAKPGDVLFTPKNTSIEFGTPSHVKVMYVTYPANWQNA